MQKVVITSAIAILLNITAMAQDKKVAVFDPAGSVENYLKEIVREEISSTLVNVGGYIVLERQMIDKVLEENKFQSGGLVDDTQVSEMGKRMGASLVFVTNITTMNNNNYYISCKMIDVQTARIDKQKTAQTSRGQTDLIPVIQKTLTEMFGEMAKEKEDTKTVAKPANNLIAEGRNIYNNNYEKLSKKDVRSTMANTAALLEYNKGITKNRKGNALLITGTSVLATGIILEGVLNGFDFDLFYSCGPTIIMGIGAAVMIPGIALKISSKKYIRKSVEMYNSGKMTTYAELKCNFTGNGVNFILSF